MTAPLQLIALTFRLGADAESRLLAEVDRIEGRGALRVLDVVFLAKGQDGTVEALEVGDNEDFGSLLASIAPSGSSGDGRSAAGDGADGEPADLPWLVCRPWRTPLTREPWLPSCWSSICGLGPLSMPFPPRAVRWSVTTSWRGMSAWPSQPRSPRWRRPPW